MGHGWAVGWNSEALEPHTVLLLCRHPTWQWHTHRHQHGQAYPPLTLPSFAQLGTGSALELADHYCTLLSMAVAMHLTTRMLLFVFGFALASISTASAEPTTYSLVNNISLQVQPRSVTGDASSAVLYYTVQAYSDCLFGIDQRTLAASPPLNLTVTRAVSGLNTSAATSQMRLEIVAMTNTGILYVYDAGNGAVFSVDQDGRWLGFMQNNSTQRLWTMAVTRTGDRVAANSAVQNRIAVLSWPSGALLYSVPIVTSGAVTFDSNNHLYISLASNILEYDDIGQLIRRRSTIGRTIANNIVALNTDTFVNATVIYSTRLRDLCWAAASSHATVNSTTCTTVQYTSSGNGALTQAFDGTIVGISSTSLLVFGAPVVAGSSSSGGVGNIVGGVIGSVVFVLLSIACFWSLCKGKLFRRSGGDTGMQADPHQARDELGRSQARRPLL